MSWLVVLKGGCCLNSQSGDCVFVAGSERRVLLEQSAWRVCLCW